MLGDDGVLDFDHEDFRDCWRNRFWAMLVERQGMHPEEAYRLMSEFEVEVDKVRAEGL